MRNVRPRYDVFRGPQVNWCACGVPLSSPPIFPPPRIRCIRLNRRVKGENVGQETHGEDRRNNSVALAWIGLRAPRLENGEKDAIWAFLPLLLRNGQRSYKKKFPVLRSCKERVLPWLKEGSRTSLERACVSEKPAVSTVSIAPSICALWRVVWCAHAWGDGN